MQYRLRTLMIGMCLAACCLAVAVPYYVAHTVRQKALHQLALQDIKVWGTEARQSGFWRGPLDLTPLKAIAEVDELELCAPNATHKHLAVIEDLRSLKALRLSTMTIDLGTARAIERSSVREVKGFVVTIDREVLKSLLEAFPNGHDSLDPDLLAHPTSAVDFDLSRD